MKHTHDKLQILTVIISILALITSIANFIFFVQFAKNYGALSGVTKARTSQLIDCVQGKKLACTSLEHIDIDIK